MKLVKERTVGSAGGDGRGVVVLVGVKFDAQSRELLTWSLMKMAQPGDSVIAIHVLDSITGFVGGTSSVLSLVKTFDSLSEVYEGFCNLKQVHLKLKVCRGSSVKKTLVREAKASAASKVIVGASKCHHTMRSSTSVAKYCARKLPKSLSVFAVSNGKIIFQREATLANPDYVQDLNRIGENCVQNSDNQISANCVQNSDNQNSANCVQNLENQNSANCDPLILDNSGAWSVEKSHNDDCDSLALVPIQISESVSSLKSTVVKELPVSKPRSSLLRRLLLLKHQHLEKSHVKKAPAIKWIIKSPSLNSSSTVYPDQKQGTSYVDEDSGSDLEGENSAIVLIGSNVAWSPISPYHGSNGLPEELKGLHEKYSASCRLFTFQELLMATSNFQPDNLVGKGGNSHVYKGCLPDGKELAVKILKPSENVLKEFIVEIEIITALHHKNIVSLFGFCFEHGHLLLVYDFLSRGSLEGNLHGNKKDKSEFGWRERYKVAVGVAEALDYLHNSCGQPVIHRDVKSSNILLTGDFEPQLSDFGLASWFNKTASSMTSTDVTGTFGYLAPEYFMHGKVSDKVDVFAFGVVLLELLSGRMPISNYNPKGHESLVMWAKPILEGGKASQLLDPHIENEYDKEEIERMVLAATLCINRSPKYRPQISLILKLLQGDKEVTDWAKQQVDASEETDAVDEEAFPSNIQSHLNIALLDLDDDSSSISSMEQSVSIEDYLKGRWSRTSSFD